MLNIIYNPDLEKKLTKNFAKIKEGFDSKAISSQWINLVEK